MNYFPVGGVSGKIKVDGEKVDLKDFELISKGAYDIFLDNAPHSFSFATAFVYDDKLHVIGGYGDTDKYITHYEWERPNKRTRLPNLPFRSEGSSVVIYDGDVHVLGYSDNGYRHYKWNPTDGWTQLGSNPINFYYGTAVVYGDDIHILGGQYYNSSTSQTEATNIHYKWNPTDGWTEVDTIPYKVRDASAVVFDNSIHLMGGLQTQNSEVNYKKHYKWNPTDGWTQLSDLPINVSGNASVVFENEIHILGGSGSGSGSYPHWIWNPTNGWHGHSTKFESGYYFSPIGVVILYDHIHVFASYQSNFKRYMLDYREYLFLRKDEKIY